MVSTRIFTEPAGLVESRSWKEKKRVPERSTICWTGVEGGWVQAALLAGEPHHAGHPRHARGRLGAPQDLVGVAAVGRRPDVADVERRLDVAGPDVRAEGPVHQVQVDREVLGPEHRVAV